MIKKKIVFWRHVITGITGQGQPLEAYVADAWVEYGNKEYPDMIHIAVDADITKMQGCSEGEK